MRMLALAEAERRRLVAMTPEARAALISRMSPEDLLKLDAMFEMWAHEGQLEPAQGGWRTWLMLAGRGFGKTRAGAEWVHQIAIGVPNRRIALVAATIDEARLVMVEGVSGLIAVAKRRGVKLRFETARGILHWPNGSQARLFSGENPDGLRGPEHHLAWSMTFELIADEEAPSIGDILSDASDGLIEAGVSGRTIGGFALYGEELREAVSLLSDMADLRLCEGEDGALTDGSGWGLSVDPKEGWAGPRDKPHPLLPSRRTTRSACSELLLRYYDPSRDYQPGQARAAVPVAEARRVTMDSAANLDAASAKSMSFDMLRRRWAEMEEREIRLPIADSGARIGSLVNFVGEDGLWKIHSLEARDMIMTASVRPVVGEAASVQADGGRVIAQSDVEVGANVPRLVELPPMEGDLSATGGMMLAVGTTGGWRSPAATLLIDDTIISSLAVPRAAIMGDAVSVLGEGSAMVRDDLSSVDIATLSDADELYHADERALALGGNLAMLGGELIQFARADKIGVGRWRLSGLYRGLRGTEARMGQHQLGDDFILLDANALVVLNLSPSRTGAQVVVETIGLADNPLAPSMATAALAGLAFAPPPPCDLQATRNGSTVTVSWRTRSWASFDWTDDGAVVEQPVRVSVTGEGQSVSASTSGISASFDESLLGFVIERVEVESMAGSIASLPAAIDLSS